MVSQADWGRKRGQSGGGRVGSAWITKALHSRTMNICIIYFLGQWLQDNELFLDEHGRGGSTHRQCLSTWVGMHPVCKAGRMRNTQISPRSSSRLVVWVMFLSGRKLMTLL